MSMFAKNCIKFIYNLTAQEKNPKIHTLICSSVFRKKLVREITKSLNASFFPIQFLANKIFDGHRGWEGFGGQRLVAIYLYVISS